MATITQFRTGDLVMVDPAHASSVPIHTLGKPFKVTKVNPKNVHAAPCDADGNVTVGARGINYPKTLLIAYDPTLPPSLPRAFEVPLPLADGTIVTLTKPYREFGTETPFIVTRDGGGKRVHIAQVGGGGMLTCGRAGVVERDLAWLTKTLVETAAAATN